MKEVARNLLNQLLNQPTIELTHLETFLKEHPVLLWPKVREGILEVALQVKQPNIHELNKLTELIEIFEQELEEKVIHRNYPFGYGPIDKIYLQAINGEISPKTAFDLAKKPSTVKLLAPVYVTGICIYAEDLVKFDPGTYGSAQFLCTLIFASVNLIPQECQIGNDWLRMLTMPVLSYLRVSHAEMHIKLNNLTFKNAVLLAESVANKEYQDNIHAHEVYHNLGALFLDSYCQGVLPEEVIRKEKEWQRNNPNVAEEDGWSSDGDLLPSPLQACEVAIHYLFMAQDMRANLSRAITLKALVQALFFRSKLTGVNDPALPDIAKEALRLFNKNSMYQNEISAVENFLNLSGIGR